MTQEEIEQLKKEVKWETVRKTPYGGQQVGVPSIGVKLIHEDTEFELTINRYRSQLQNRELAMILFELYLSTF